MMPANKAPPVIPQPVFRAMQIFDVQQELIFCFLLPGGPVQRHAGAIQKQHRHKQRVIPQLLGIHAIAGNMLEAALLRARQPRHHPFRPSLNQGQVLRLLRFFIKQHHPQHGRGGVDIGLGQLPADMAGIPGLNFRQKRRIPCGQIQLHHRIHRHALRPFPGGQAQMIVPAAVPRAVFQPVHNQISHLLIIHVFTPSSMSFFLHHIKLLPVRQAHLFVFSP